MSELSAGLFSGFSSLAGNIVQNYVQDQRDEQAREWQEKMLAQANAYNHPSAVMARMKQAGINPNLIVGQPIQGSASVPQASQGSKSASFDDIAPNTLNAIMQAKQIELQEKQIESATRLEEQQSALTHEEARRMKRENDARDKGYNTTSSVTAYTNDGQKGETTTTTTHHDYYDAQIANEIQGFLTDRGIKIDEGYRSSIKTILMEHQLTFSWERVEHVADYIAKELRAMDDEHNVSEARVNLIGQQINSMWTDVAQGLYHKNHIQLDENGKPLDLKDEWVVYYQTKEIVMDVLDALGQGANVIGAIRGAVAKKNQPQMPFSQHKTTEYYDENGAFKGHVNTHVDYGQ